MKKLKLLIEKENLTAIRLAQILDVFPQTIRKWARDEGMPRSDKLLLLADTLYCTIDQM